MWGRVILFALASLGPVPLIAAGAAWGGLWAHAAFLAMTLLVFLLDEGGGALFGREGLSTFPRAAAALPVALALAHFALFWFVIAALARGAPGPWGWLPAFLAAALWFGQVSNANAHELIHARDRLRRRLGVLVYVSLLFGHHASAHPLVHHRHVGTPADPNSARKGQSYYSFWRQAWIGSFRAGLAAETARCKAAGRRGLLGHPYTGYIAGALAALGLSWALAGWAGVAVHFALASLAQAQLLMSDYVQHYGLRRREVAPGRLEPVSPRHSWNAPHWFSSHMMLNAPRHSDHHAHPLKPYPALELPEERAAPTLPYSLPAMGMIALWPRAWRRVMDRRLASWEAPAESDRRAPPAPRDAGTGQRAGA